MGSLALYGSPRFGYTEWVDAFGAPLRSKKPLSAMIQGEERTVLCAVCGEMWSSR
jgi:hypothetical protein